MLLIFLFRKSHPSWVCGLKPTSRNITKKSIKSHPSWVCGLKQGQAALMQGRAASHPSWVCGLKPIDYFTSVLPRAVTPFVGVWIETVSGRSALGFQTSHPSWVCGLKQQTFAHAATVQGVTPFVGVWIETCCRSTRFDSCWVTPFVGVWIETKIYRSFKKMVFSHTLRGCVD